MRDKKLPFHKWYKWLEDNFAELRAKFHKDDKNSKPIYSHLSASDEHFASLEKRTPDSAKNKGPGLFSKLKQAITKKDEHGVSRLSFGRKSMKKSNSQQVTYEK